MKQIDRSSGMPGDIEELGKQVKLVKAVKVHLGLSDEIKKPIYLDITRRISSINRR